MNAMLNTPVNLRKTGKRIGNGVFTAFFLIFMRAVLHKEFVGARSDKLLGAARPESAACGRSTPRLGKIVAWHNGGRQIAVSCFTEPVASL